MKLQEVLTPSFRTLGRELGLKVEVFEDRLVIMAPMWRKALSTESRFCKAVVASGYLTEAQMLRAARRYRLGSTRQGGVIFWQMDAEGAVCDGKVMYYRENCHRDHQQHPTWVSSLLARRYRWADAERMTTRHCLFGLHLLGHTDCFKGHPVCVVESEKTAVILSEHFPGYVWIATGGLGNVQADKFRPLRGRRVILFPDTDAEGTAFKRWYAAAQEVLHQPFWEGCPPITVSPLLELHATAKQKQDKIDLVDFLFAQGMEPPNGMFEASKQVV